MMAATDRSASFSVVAQELIDNLMIRCPFHCVLAAKQIPSACTRSITRLVNLSPAMLERSAPKRIAT